MKEFNINREILNMVLCGIFSAIFLHIAFHFKDRLWLEIIFGIVAAPFLLSILGSGARLLKSICYDRQ